MTFTELAKAAKPGRAAVDEVAAKALAGLRNIESNPSEPAAPAPIRSERRSSSG